MKFMVALFGYGSYNFAPQFVDTGARSTKSPWTFSQGTHLELPGQDSLPASRVA